MNLFDYHNKKDLQGRTGSSSRGPAPAAKPTRPSQTSAGPAPTHARTTRSRVNITNRVSDKWITSHVFENYRDKTLAATKAALDDPFEKYRVLLPEWFSGEQIKYVTRRHWIHIFYLGKPALLLLPLLLIALIASIFFPIAWVVVAFFGLIELAMWAWFINDWSNDYLIITNRRVIDLERVTFFNSEKIEIPLDKVQEVKVATRRNFLEYTFRAGTVTITSSGRTSIIFNRVHDPEAIRSAWANLRKSYVMARTQFRKDRMTNYLENKIWGTPLVNWNAQENERALHVISKDEVSWFQQLIPTEPVWDNQARTITWYTHPWILFRQVFPLVIGFFILLIGGVIGIPFLFAFSGLLGTIGLLVMIVALVVLGFMIWYRYENWHNDRYIVSDDRITDIIKLPFGFDETQSIVEIRNVQDTEYEKRGFTANWFNFGSVKVTTTGGPALTFKNIPTPEIVDDEISRRKEILRYLDEDRQDRLTADFFATYRDVLLHPEDHAPSSDPGRPHRLDEQR